MNAVTNTGPPPLARLLPPGAVRLGAAAAGWRDAIRRAGEALTASGATDSAYADEMIDTVEELGPYIVIAPGIALAHSRPSPAVHRAGISIVTLSDPVPFGHPANDPVTLVIGLAAPDADAHVEALAVLAEFLMDDARRAALLAATSPEVVYGLISAWEHGTAVDGRDGADAPAGGAEPAGKGGQERS